MRWMLLMLMLVGPIARADDCTDLHNLLQNEKQRLDKEILRVERVRRNLAETEASGQSKPALASARRQVEEAEMEQRRSASLVARYERGVSECEENERAKAERSELERQRRAEAAREKQEQDALIQQRLRDPRYMRPVLSALVCKQLAVRKEALDFIAKKRKYARIGGAINLKEIHEAQEDIEGADDKLAELRTQARTMKLALQPCGDRLVTGLVICLNDDEPDTCKSPPLSDFLDLVE